MFIIEVVVGGVVLECIILKGVSTTFFIFRFGLLFGFNVVADQCMSVLCLQLVPLPPSGQKRSVNAALKTVTIITSWTFAVKK